MMTAKFRVFFVYCKYKKNHGFLICFDQKKFEPAFSQTYGQFNLILDIEHYKP